MDGSGGHEIGDLEDPETCREGGTHTVARVLQRPGAARVDAQQSGGGPVGFGIGLALLDSIAGDSDGKVLVETRQRESDRSLRVPRRSGEGAGDGVSTHPLQHLERARLDRRRLANQAFVAVGVPARYDRVVREIWSVALDQQLARALRRRADAAMVGAGIGSHSLGAARVQEPVQSDPLSVEEQAVHVEDKRCRASQVPGRFACRFPSLRHGPSADSASRAEGKDTAAAHRREQDDNSQ